MPKKQPGITTLSALSDLLTPDTLRLLSANKDEWIQQVGMDVIRGVVLDVLTGKNLRDSTEFLTRRRIAALNLATVHLFLKGSATYGDFVDQLPQLAASILTQKRLSRAERWLAQWVLGLTDKSFQNVLRDDPNALRHYRDGYIAACRDVVASQRQEHGELTGVLELDSGLKAEMNWLLMTYLLNTVGAQTLAIRGSEKSFYGKLFEKLILGSMLHVLGFKYVRPEEPGQLKGVFWLASRGEKRESDATLLYDAGKGVRFDIGFIGRGNPEISLDKVTRFERELTMGRSHWYMATIIIVDRIGPNSRIEQLAAEVGGTIVQMSAAYWPQQIAHELNRAFGFKHELVNMEAAQIAPFLKRKLQDVPLEAFIALAPK
ncbi:MAG: CfrBI family restriction endonuclease [Chloroflexi bacterium]|nr:CfrBI family restriction endonuclease [Chloroflexota bacterium]